MAFLSSRKPIMVVGCSTMASSISDIKKTGSTGLGRGNRSGTDKKMPVLQMEQALMTAVPSRKSGQSVVVGTIDCSNALGTDR